MKKVTFWMVLVPFKKTLLYVLHRIHNHYPDVLYLAEIICRFVPKTQNLRTDKSVSNHEERIYNSICINSHMKYKYCITFGNNIEWLSHLVLLSKVIQNWKFANQKMVLPSLSDQKTSAVYNVG